MRNGHEPDLLQVHVSSPKHLPCQRHWKQTEHGREFFLNLEKGNAAALAHAGDMVECCARPHCSTLNLPPADMGSISGLSLLAVVQ